MFSPDASVRTVSGGSTRNPRRRQRHDTDSVKQQPVRKRSKLSDQTFATPDSKANGNGHIAVNGHSEHEPRRASGTQTQQLTVREKKKDRRAAKEDGTTLLVRIASAPCLSRCKTNGRQTKTGLYLVKQLPAVPEKLRSNTTGAHLFPIAST